MRSSKRTVQQSRVQTAKSPINKKASSVNQDYLKKSLKLLGVTDERFEKETKSSLKNEIFPRTLPNATNSKQFFFICWMCAKNILTAEQSEELTMWYPPRTVNEQIQFKKTLFKLLQKAEAHGRLPKNILISKMVLMGEGTSQSIVQFLRIFTQLSLRALYIEKYSKKERLIQVAVNNSPQLSSQNDINKFYVFPFTETVTNVQSPLKSPEQAQQIKLIFKVHIDNYRKKLLALRTVDETEAINPQTLMTTILEQKQLASTLQSKVSKSIYSQNRAFDRRVILDKNAQTWKQLMSIPCNFIDQEDGSVLKVEGETAKVLSNWRPVSGTPHLIEIANEKQRIADLKRKCEQKVKDLDQMRTKLLGMMRNA